MLISDFFVDGKWEVEYPGMSTFEIVKIFVSEKKPKTFLELGTGKNANYATSICFSMSEYDDKTFISYELSNSDCKSAKQKLSKFDSFSKIHCDNMFNFFDDYKDLIPDMYMLDAGDEKLWSNQNNAGDWVVEGKDYGEESLFAKGESENLTFFLQIQNQRSKKGTYVILDDFLSGRGTYISNYMLSNEEEFNSNWEILNIFGSGESSICLLERK